MTRNHQTRPEGASPRVRLLAGALAIAVPVLVLVLLEISLRAFGYGYRPEFLVKIEGREAYTTNQKYGWRFFPRAMARAPVFCSLPAGKPPGTYRIFVLGESAAMGVPEPAFGFARILEAMLGKRFPGVRFEVVNAAMTAISSHVILPIARDCALHSPDLFLVYAGNNEVVGPYGAGTAFHRYSPSLSLIRAGIWFGASRTGQLTQDAVSLLTSGEGGRKEWGGMAMFREHLVTADDPRLLKVYANFGANLADVCRTAERAGAGVILCTVATNLRDSAPFSSAHRSGLSPEERARWDTLYDSAIALERTGELSRALEGYRQAAGLDDRYAELHFRLGRCLLNIGKVGEAREHYVLARDLDSLRFRADSRINQTIREVAAHSEREGVRLVDAERAFNDAENGVAGEALFYEHVHANFAGNYVLAQAVFRQVAAMLPDWVRRRESKSAEPSLARTAELLCLTGWDEYKMAAEMFALMDQPPFTSRMEAGAERARREQRLAELREKYATAEAKAEARAAYAAALRRRPEDLELRLRFAALLRECGDHAGAAQQWLALVRRVPGVARWHASLGDALRDQGRLLEAARQQEAALRINPKLAEAHFGMAAVLERQGKLEEAAAGYSRALRLKPDYAEAHNNLGAILTRRGELNEAVAHYREALRIKPDFTEAHNNLGVALSKLGQVQEAIIHYSAALRINPGYAAAHYDLGSALAGLGQMGQAIVHYEEALRIRPDYTEARDGLAAAHNNLGTELARQGRTAEAISHLRRAVALRPDLAEAHFNLGVVLAGAGRMKEAAGQYADALRLRPGFTQARIRLEDALARTQSR